MPTFRSWKDPLLCNIQYKMWDKIHHCPRQKHIISWELWTLSHITYCDIVLGRNGEEEQWQLSRFVEELLKNMSLTSKQGDFNCSEPLERECADALYTSWNNGITFKKWIMLILTHFLDWVSLKALKIPFVTQFNEPSTQSTEATNHTDWKRNFIFNITAVVVDFMYIFLTYNETI